MNPDWTIKEDKVDTEAILPNAISYSYYVTLTSTIPLPYNSVEAILSLTIPNVQAGELLRILGNVRLHSANDLTGRSEEHTSELQSLMRISYAVSCLKKKLLNEMIHITHIALTIME